ncbi:MAG: TlpA family protein disulfide reductase [Sphingobacteriia bacterium]|nr:MAG: TlpA family protein disulfide reductase [Sphingobacteriia bacterium]
MFDENVLQSKKMIARLQLTSIKKASEDLAVKYATNNETFISFTEAEDQLFEMGLYNKENFKYQYLKDTLTINGLLCNIAIIHCLIDDQNMDIEVWYFKDLKIDLNNFKYIFSDLNGLPVKIKYREAPRMKFPGMENLLVMNEISLINYTDSFLEDVAKVANEEKYVVGNNSTYQQDIIGMMGMNSRLKADFTPKGEPIKSTISSGNGTTIELTKYNPFKLNEPLTPFVGKTLAGNEIKSTDFNNKVLVLNFWFVECQPCIKELPILNNVKASFEGQPVVFLSINHQSAKAIETFLKAKQYNFTHIVNAQHLIDLYGIATYPATVIVDKKGIIRFVEIGDFKNEQALSSEIKKLLS